jgi:paraquat-inducible protein B
MSTDENQANDNAEFELFKSQNESVKKDYSKGMKFVVNFSDTVRGLSVGAPVSFRGIQLGEVTAIRAEFDSESNTISIPVTIEIDHSKIHFTGNEQAINQFANRKRRLNTLIKRGLRSQLETGNILTGQLFVSLNFFPETKPYVIDWDAKIPEFPAVPTVFGAVKTDITSILKKVNSMMTQINEFSYKLNHNLGDEFSTTLKQVNAMMVQIKELSYKLNHNLEPDLSKALKQMDKTLVSIEAVLKKDSPLQEELHMTLREFSRAAESIKRLTDYLERHPESLLKGKGH